MSNPVDDCQTGVGSTLKKRPKKRSKAWEHFHEAPDGQRAICKYCNADLSASSKAGTTHLLRHSESCQKRPKGDLNQPPTIDFGVEEEVRNFNLTQEKSWEVEVKKAILADVPFAPSDCKKALCSLMGLVDVEKEICTYYQREKEKLANELKNLTSRVCLSIARMKKLGYISITAHFINEDFNLVKKLIGFTEINDFSSYIWVGDTIRGCVSDWKLEGKIFSSTNSSDCWFSVASACDCCFDVECYKARMSIGVHLPISYYYYWAKHILDLVQGLTAVPNRMDTFNQIAIGRGLPSINKSWLNEYAGCRSHWECQDLEYSEAAVQIFKKAVVYKDVFEYLRANPNAGRLIVETEGGLELRSLSSGCVPAESDNLYYIDWKQVERAVKFSDMVRETKIIDRLSIFMLPTSNLCFPFVVEMHEKFQLDNDPFYLRIIDKSISNTILFACVLDPRYKQDIINYYIKKYGISSNIALNKFDSRLQDLFYEYAKEETKEASPLRNGFTITQNEGPSSNFVHPSCPTIKGFSKYRKELKEKRKKSELDEYLSDELVDTGDTSFDLLGWWKENRLRYPVLSRIARDVLAIPACVYSVEGIISSDFRIPEGVSPELVEAVICSKDWILSDKQSAPEPKY